LPPILVDEEAWTIEVTLPVDGSRPRTVRIAETRPGSAAVTVLGRLPGRRGVSSLLSRVRRTLNLEEDLSDFYAMARGDPDLAWVAHGAGRMIRSSSVFGDVVKTICTTNCAWSATKRMVTALVADLGEPAPGAPPDGWRGRTFPTPEAMATAGNRFYRSIARAGYRGAYLRAIAQSVTKGSVNLEVLAQDANLSDDEVYRRLLTLLGVGPYAAAHIMMLIGRHSRLILDSWTRPKYAQLQGRRKPFADSTVIRRFRRYGRYAGLAFWLYLTRDWVPEEAISQVMRSSRGALDEQEVIS
jgi:N-glycosylase/DNA lyase